MRIMDCYAGKISFVLGGLSMLLLLPTEISIYAQEPADFQEIKGKFASNESGIEITFPNGWAGGAFESPELLQAIVVPGGFPAPNITKSITVATAPFIIGDDPIDPVLLDYYMSHCKAPSIKARTVSGVQGIELHAECPESPETGFTHRIVAVATKDRLVALVYKSPSSEFESSLEEFNAAVDSLKVEGARDSALGSGTPVKTGHFDTVIVAGKPVEVRTTVTSGVVDEFDFDEQTRTASFKVFATDETTTVLIGSILEGPYIVTIDGDQTDSFEESLSYPGVATLSISHGSGTHYFTITGTQVVPEFPSEALAVIVAMIVITIVITRGTQMKWNIRELN